ncbi:hypothetical protein SpCBS45565_g03121 [Spizellomyces sp. 'palustris']|nr:hypothetical protein SpCBS45565_g03121 [Spizellomyces sp. 'palustris']
MNTQISKPAEPLVLSRHNKASSVSSCSYSSSSSWISDTTTLVDITDIMVSLYSPIQDLPTDLLLHLLRYLPPLSLHTLSRTCKPLHKLIAANLDALYRYHTITRFGLSSPHLKHYHALRLAHEGIQEQTWADMYWRLTVCKTRWVGWALDRATNGFEAYAMEFVIRDVGLLSKRKGDMSIDAVCRWRSVGDALTGVSGTLSIPSHHSTQPTSISFVEHTLLRGPNTIALPNRYVGSIWGSVMIGWYDPGGTRDMRGVFGVVMEECFGEDCIAPSSNLDDQPLFDMLSDGRQVIFNYSGILTNVEEGTNYSIALRVDLLSNTGSLAIANGNSSRPFTLCASGRTLYVQLPSPPSTNSEALSWWEIPRFNGPEGEVDLRKVGNGVLGLFREPALGVFYVRPCGEDQNYR